MPSAATGLTTRHQANLLGAEAPVVAAVRRRPSAPFPHFDEQLQEILPVVGGPANTHAPVKLVCGPAVCCGPARAAAQRMLRLSGVLRPSGIAAFVGSMKRTAPFPGLPMTETPQKQGAFAKTRLGSMPGILANSLVLIRPSHARPAWSRGVARSRKRGSTSRLVLTKLEVMLPLRQGSHLVCA